MEKKWYKNWISWLTILLLLFVPTFLIGIIVMWILTPWSKRAKWWVTGIGLGIPLIGIAVSLFLVFMSPKKTAFQMTDQATDANRRSAVQTISSSATRFCLEKGRCANNLNELKSTGFLSEIPIDPKTNLEYPYQILNSGKECKIEIELSDGKNFIKYCIDQTLQ